MGKRVGVLRFQISRSVLADQTRPQAFVERSFGSRALIGQNGRKVGVFLVSFCHRPDKWGRCGLGAILNAGKNGGLHRIGKGLLTFARTTCAVPVVLAFDPQLAAQLGLSASSDPLRCRAHGRVALEASLPPIPTG